MLLSENNKKKWMICLIFLTVYYLIFGLTSFVSGLRQDRIIIAFPFEADIPFYPAWSIIYISLNFYLILSLFIFRHWQTMASFAITLLIETIIAGCFFIIFPLKLTYSNEMTTGIFSNIVFIAKFFSMNNNYFPSLHTAFAFTAALAYSQYCSKAVKLLFYSWACLIPLSTLFIHEHHLIDLFGGFLLAILAYHYFFIRLEGSRKII